MENEKAKRRGKYVRTKETREKMSISHQGKVCSDETKEKMSKARQGENNPNFGRKFSNEHRKRMSISMLKCRPDGYCDAWSDKEFKNDFRKDICEICGVKAKIAICKDGKLYPNLILHHIDINKRNCHPNNLQTLCRSCHQKLHLKLRIGKN